MHAQSTATMRFFGCLHTLRRERGLSSEAEVPLPADGLTGEELARALELPLEMVEAVVVNRKVYGLEHRVRPGGPGRVRAPGHPWTPPLHPGHLQRRPGGGAAGPVGAGLPANGFLPGYVRRES